MINFVTLSKYLYLLYSYLYLLATRQNSKMIPKEDNTLKQIKKRGKRKKSTHIIYYNYLQHSYMLARALIG